MAENALQIHRITQGDTATPIRRQIKSGGTVKNLSGYTATFSMVDNDGAAAGGGSAVIEDAANGVVAYRFQATDVDTPGTFWGWFVLNSGSGVDHAPHDGRKLQLEIFAKET